MLVDAAGIAVSCIARDTTAGDDALEASNAGGRVGAAKEVPTRFNLPMVMCSNWVQLPAPPRCMEQQAFHEVIVLTKMSCVPGRCGDHSLVPAEEQEQREEEDRALGIQFLLPAEDGHC